MTPEEKRKYRWLKPLAYIACYGYEWPVRIVLALTILLPGLMLERAGDKMQDLFYFLWNWIATRPPYILLNSIGFFELHMKAQKFERYKKTMEQD